MTFPGSGMPVRWETNHAYLAVPPSCLWVLSIHSVLDYAVMAYMQATTQGLRNPGLVIPWLMMLMAIGATLRPSALRICLFKLLPYFCHLLSESLHNHMLSLQVARDLKVGCYPLNSLLAWEDMKLPDPGACLMRTGHHHSWAGVICTGLMDRTGCKNAKAFQTCLDCPQYWRDLQEIIWKPSCLHLARSVFQDVWLGKMSSGNLDVIAVLPFTPYEELMLF